jgi:AraC-like DNA-binding protein
MSNSRQRLDPQVRAVAIGFSSGYRWRNGPSDWHQLVRASPGIIRVEFGDRSFVVPPHQALWIPANLPHVVVMGGRGALQRVYVREIRGRQVPGTAGVVPLTPLLREVLRRVHRLGTLHRGRAGERHLMDLMLDECQHSSGYPISLPLPTDPRAARAAEHLRRHPRSPRHALQRAAHASLRTLERLFRAETGLSLGAWHRRCRLMDALAQLADGQSVSATALAVGYATSSAFVAAFKRETGSTPARFFRAPTPGGDSALPRVPRTTQRRA